MRSSFSPVGRDKFPCFVDMNQVYSFVFEHPNSPIDEIMGDYCRHFGIEGDKALRTVLEADLDFLVDSGQIEFVEGHYHAIGFLTGNY